jgi:hypothetical protein
MARTFALRIPGVAEVQATMEKFQRSDLYGRKYVEKRDDNGNRLSLARITWDGKHVIPEKGMAMVHLDEDKKFVASEDIYDVNKEGEPMALFTSSYKTGIELTNTIPVEEYFNYNIETTYKISSEADPASFILIQSACDSLKRDGRLYTFQYAYLDTFYPQVGIIISHEGELVVAIGDKFEPRWVGPATDVEELFKDIDDDEEEDITFGEAW